MKRKDASKIDVRTSVGVTRLVRIHHNVIKCILTGLLLIVLMFDNISGPFFNDIIEEFNFFLV